MNTSMENKRAKEDIVYEEKPDIATCCGFCGLRFSHMHKKGTLPKEFISMEKSKECCEKCKGGCIQGGCICGDCPKKYLCPCHTSKVEKSPVDRMMNAIKDNEEGTNYPTGAFTEKSELSVCCGKEAMQVFPSGYDNPGEIVCCRCRKPFVPQPEVKECEGVHHGNCGAPDCILNRGVLSDKIRTLPKPEVKVWEVEELWPEWLDAINTDLKLELADDVFDWWVNKVKLLLAAQAKGFEDKERRIREKIKGMKRILWSEDDAQHIRNIQNNETITEILQILTEDKE